MPADKLTHLIYAFAQIDGQGRVGLFDPYAAVEKRFQAADSVDGRADTWDQALAGNFHQLAKLKDANPDLSVLIAVGGWTLSGPFSDVAATAQGRATLAQSLVDFLVTYPMFGGVDFDWEYPGGGGLPSNPVRPEDGLNYALLLGEVRAQLDRLEQQTGREYEISVASPAGLDKIADFNLSGLAPHVDFFNVMAYDFHGGWETTSGHQAPLFDTQGARLDITSAIQAYREAGIDPAQIVLGAPTYTRAWAGVPDGGDGGWNAPASGLPAGTFEAGVYDYKDILAQIQAPGSGWTVYWDDDAQAAYAYHAEQGVFTTLESAGSIALKSAWAQDLGLGGMMFWDLSSDVAAGPESLIEAAYRSWMLGESFDAIVASSTLRPDVIRGGNGQWDPVSGATAPVPDVPVPEPDPLPDPEPLPEPGGEEAPGASVVHAITWSWGKNVVIDFDPRVDVLDFGWMSADHFRVSEVDDTLWIAIPSNQQTYVLPEVGLADLSLANIRALDSSALLAWETWLD